MATIIGNFIHDFTAESEIQHNYHHLNTQLKNHWQQPVSFLEKPFENLLTVLLENANCTYIVNNKWHLIFKNSNTFVWSYPGDNQESIHHFEQALKQACIKWRDDAPYLPFDAPVCKDKIAEEACSNLAEPQVKKQSLIPMKVNEITVHNELQCEIIANISFDSCLPSIEETIKLLQTKKEQYTNAEELAQQLGLIKEDIEHLKSLKHQETLTEKINDIGIFYYQFKQKLQDSALNKNNRLLIQDKLKMLEECLLQQKAKQQILLIEKKLEKFSLQQKQHGLHLSQIYAEEHCKDSLINLLKEISRYCLKQRYPGGKLYICCARAPEYQQEESWQQNFLVVLREHLRAANITAILDIKDNQLGDNNYKFMKQAEMSDYVLVVGSLSLLKNHEDSNSDLVTELTGIVDKRKKDEKQGLSRVLPILLSGEIKTALPPYFYMYTTIGSWVGEGYLHCLRQLIERIYNIPEEDKTTGKFQQLWQDFLAKSPVAQTCYQPLPEEKIQQLIQSKSAAPIISSHSATAAPSHHEQSIANANAKSHHEEVNKKQCLEKEKQESQKLLQQTASSFFNNSCYVFSFTFLSAILLAIYFMMKKLLSDKSLDADKKIPLPAKQTKKESRSNSEKAIPKSVQAVNQKQIYQDCETLAKTPVPASNEKQKQQTLALCHRFFQTPIITSEPPDEAALKQTCEQANPLQEVELLPNAVQHIQPTIKLLNTLCHWLSNEPADNSSSQGHDLQSNLQSK